MSDLARLLDDVYTNVTPKPATPPAPDTGLAWTSATTIDEAFADWVPGPHAGSPQAERDLFALVEGDEPVAAPEPFEPFELVLVPPMADDDDEVEVEVEVEAPAPIAATDEQLPAAPDVAPDAVATTWRRDHDDLLPTRGRRRRR